jgi:undecaprenyl pyrophosphate synthase
MIINLDQIKQFLKKRGKDNAAEELLAGKTAQKTVSVCDKMNIEHVRVWTFSL